MFWKKKPKITCVFSDTGECINCGYLNDTEIKTKCDFWTVCKYCQRIIVKANHKEWETERKWKKEKEQKKFNNLKNALKQALVEIEKEKK